MNKGLLIVVSSPSGGGKTTLIRKLRAQLPQVGYSVSVTTRAPRPGEVSGKDYTFVTPAEFEELKRGGRLLEWANVHGNSYGTLRSSVEEVLNRGEDLVLDIDVQGAKQIREKFPQALLIFILPPSLAELKKRLNARQQDDAATIQRRLEAASREIQEARWYDYLITNADVSQAIEQLVRVIAAEKLKTARNLNAIESFQRIPHP